MSGQIIGEVTGTTGYDGLAVILRTWIADLGTTYDAVDELALQPARNTSKMLSRRPVKGLGRSTLGPLLGALGLKLAVMVDPAALAKVKHRLTSTKWTKKHQATQRRKIMEAAAAVTQAAHTGLIPACGKHHFAGNSEWGRAAQAARLAGMSQEARSRQASKAVNARWKAARRRLREAAAEARAPL